MSAEDRFEDPVERDHGVFIEPGKGRESHSAPPIDPAEEDEADTWTTGEKGLWLKQKALIQEDEDDGVKLGGFSEDQASRVLDAMGDDVAESLPDAPNGISATGSPDEPDHGGFPERG